MKKTSLKKVEKTMKKKAAPPKSQRAVGKKVEKKAVKKGSLKKMAARISKTTKKVVDDVLLRLIGTRVLERAQKVSASIKNEKSRLKKAQEE